MLNSKQLTVKRPTAKTCAIHVDSLLCCMERAFVRLSGWPEQPRLSPQGCSRVCECRCDEPPRKVGKTKVATGLGCRAARRQWCSGHAVAPPLPTCIRHNRECANDQAFTSVLPPSQNHQCSAESLWRPSGRLLRTRARSPSA